MQMRETENGAQFGSAVDNTGCFWILVVSQPAFVAIEEKTLRDRRNLFFTTPDFLLEHLLAKQLWIWPLIDTV
jgi:hypothetical protein